MRAKSERLVETRPAGMLVVMARACSLIRATAADFPTNLLYPYK